MTLHDLSIHALDGAPLDLSSLRGQAVLVVNVASKCGLTPQYEALEKLQQEYGNQGFTVLGAPCNQFAGQEPGTAEEIAEFCSTTYGVSFPLTEKLDVNGQRRHPLYEQLAATADDAGRAGDVEWNFEKFLVSPKGEVLRRFRPPVKPDADEVVEAVKAALPQWKNVPVAEVRPGDVVRTRGQVVEVARVEDEFMGRKEMMAIIVDGPNRWLKLPTQASAEVELLV